ncbi:hypothetical protein [Shewanella marina]|uniref:hypothetical protein n=1 Tax=Shewanella marina TaxID=487319 RepID=UPI0004704E47|nr:hypothetical protein [Shewanella marina]
MQKVDITNSGVWKHLVELPEGSAGFRMRGSLPTDENGAVLMIEHWNKGMIETPHFHPGDDMTIVMAGIMAVQPHILVDGQWQHDGEEQVYHVGETAYLKATQVHSVRYLEDTKLVYIHDGEFDLTEVELNL